MRRTDYLTTVNYVIGWGYNDRTSSSGFGGNHDEAMQRAGRLVEQMRRDGAASAVRRVRVQHWPEGAELAGAPVLYEASYYDREQALTDAEVYAARVHDWHVLVDRLNGHYAKTGANIRAGYRPWSDDWGVMPQSCPACAAAF